MQTLEEMNYANVDELDEIDTPSVLIVDDSSVFRLIISDLIKSSCSYSTTSVADGEEAIRFLKDHQPTIILTDLHMPKVNGLELVEYVRENYPNLPIVLMTAEGSEDTALQALQLGAASYVPKKRLKSDLGQILNQVIQASKTDRRKQRLLNSLTHRDSRYCLENDPDLVHLLIAMFQDELTATGVCNSSDRTRIGVALEEAMLNGIYHGNLEVSSELKLRGNAFHELAEKRKTQSPYMERRLFVRSQLTPDQVTYTIRDEGPGFDITKLADPTDPEYLERPSGRGLLLIRTFMDEVTYNATGNVITMVKKRKK